jgi:hypothetical protein
MSFVFLQWISIPRPGRPYIKNIFLVEAYIISR